MSAPPPEEPSREQVFYETTQELMGKLQNLMFRIYKFDKEGQRRTEKFFKWYEKMMVEQGIESVAGLYTDLFENNKMRILYDTSTQWIFTGTPVEIPLGKYSLKLGEMCGQLAATFLKDDKDLILRIDMLLARAFTTIYGYEGVYEMLKTRIIEHELALGLRESVDGNIAGLPGMVTYVSDMIDTNLPLIGSKLPAPMVNGIRALQTNIKSKDLRGDTVQTVMESVQETVDSEEGKCARQYVDGFLAEQPVLATISEKISNIDSIDSGMDCFATLATDPVAVNEFKKAANSMTSMIPGSQVSEETQTAHDEIIGDQGFEEDPGYF